MLLILIDTVSLSTVEHFRRTRQSNTLSTFIAIANRAQRIDAVPFLETRAVR